MEWMFAMGVQWACEIIVNLILTQSIKMTVRYMKIGIFKKPHSRLGRRPCTTCKLHSIFHCDLLLITFPPILIAAWEQHEASLNYKDKA